MKSRTSFFNTTVLKKDLTRFAPVWVLYAIFQVLFVLLMWGDRGEAARFAVIAADMLEGMGVLNLLYGGLCAVLLFGDLFKSRMCNMLHAMPLRREGWFFTHLTAGVLFCLIPNTMGALLAALLLQQYAYAAFLWLAVMALQYLFFFGAGVFACMCAGNRIGGIAVYSIFNFFAVLAAWLAATFYQPVLYGVTLDLERYVNYSPAIGFSMSEYFGFDYDNMRSVADFTGFVGEDWRYLFIAAGVGAVLLAASLLLYRRRDLESAGDLISYRPVAPVFLVIYTLCAGAVMYAIADSFSGGLEYVFLLIGLGIGFFTGKMLLEKRVNVFCKQTFLRFGILVGAFILSIVITLADPFGITRYVPAAEQVSSVSISPYTSVYYLTHNNCTLTDPADIEVITALHSELLQDRSDSGNGTLVIRYQLKDGRTVQRQYSVHTDSDQGEKLKQFYSRAQTVLGSDDIDALCRTMVRIEVYPYNENDLPHMVISNTDRIAGLDQAYVDKYAEEENLIDIQEAFTESQKVRGLLNAMLTDCAQGKMAQDWCYHNKDGFCSITFTTVYNGQQFDYRDITVYTDAANTIAFLKTIAQ